MPMHVFLATQPTAWAALPEVGGLTVIHFGEDAVAAYISEPRSEAPTAIQTFAAQLTERNLVPPGASDVACDQESPPLVETLMGATLGAGSKLMPTAAQRVGPPHETSTRVALKKGVGCPVP